MRLNYYFGPRGHTHNGQDANHKIHNNECENFNSVTLAEFFTTFTHAWKDPDARPQPVVMETLYDWDAYYAPHMNFVSGVMSNKHCALYVRAVKLSVGEVGLLKWFTKGLPLILCGPARIMTIILTQMDWLF